MTDAVLVEHVGSASVITIIRPKSKNAINRAVAVGLAAAYQELDERDDLTLAILTGAGGTFCAGMDLRAFLDNEIGNTDDLDGGSEANYVPSKPMIAAVEGWALAGGCELALGCDLIVAAEDAKFGLPEVKRGLVAGGGGLLRLPRRIPPAIAMEVALTGDPLTAAEAYRHGLVNAVTANGARPRRRPRAGRSDHRQRPGPSSRPSGFWTAPPTGPSRRASRSRSPS